MDALGEQYATAVARQRAAAGLVIIALRTPEPDCGGCGYKAAELLFSQQGPQRLAGRAESMLQDDTQRHAGGATEFHQLNRPLGADLQRLLQEDVLAGHGGLPDQVEMRVGRGQDQHGANALVGKHDIQAVGQRKRESLSEAPAPSLARAEGMGDLDQIAEIQKRSGVRCHRHAESDNCDPGAGH
jgi:hypothetical protein